MPVVKALPKPFVGRSDPVTGALWVIFSMATLCGLTACAKQLSIDGVHPFQVVFFRNLFAAIVFSPLLFYRGTSLFDTGQLPTYGFRCAVALASMLLWFFALSKIPIGEVTAITFLTPLCGTLGAIFFLGEKVRARRWTALGVGFVGALIILRPGVSPLNGGHLAALLSTITGGMSAILVKQLTARDDPNKIVFLTHLFLAPMSLIPALFVWQWPPLTTVPLLLGMGVFATLGHASLVRGYALMDASLALTFEFSKLPFVALIAFVFFNETIDRWTWLGSLVIIGSATYIARREAQVRAAARAQASAENAAAAPPRAKLSLVANSGAPEAGNEAPVAAPARKIVNPATLQKHAQRRRNRRRRR